MRGRLTRIKSEGLGGSSGVFGEFRLGSEVFDGDGDGFRGGEVVFGVEAVFGGVGGGVGGVGVRAGVVEFVGANGGSEVGAAVRFGGEGLLVGDLVAGAIGFEGAVVF